MKLLNTMSALDIDGWLRGIIGGFISGGASAVTGSIVLPALDAKDFNVYTSKFYIAIGALFLANGIVSVTKFLSSQPLPLMKQVTTTTETVTGTVGGGKVPATLVTKKIEETHVEPISPTKS
jgi:hypothetical protein